MGRSTEAGKGAARLARADWVAAGLKLLAERGIDAVAVEPLCERLGVTKGSFYWHFADRAALHAAMLDLWRERGTAEIVERTTRVTGGPGAQLKFLFGIAAASPSARLETAIRSWAIQDPVAAKAVAAVDRERVRYVATLLRQMGVPAARALVRASVIHCALIGSFLAASYSPRAASTKVWAELTRYAESVDYKA